MDCTISEGFAAAPAASNHRRGAEPRFPEVCFIKGRGYVLRSDLNRYKSELQAFALGVAPSDPPRSDPDPLVPLPAVAAELGVGRRTIGRRIADRQGGEAA